MEGFSDTDRLRALEVALRQRGADVALAVVFERPTQVDVRPGLAKTFFAQRCISDLQIDQMVSAMRSIGAYVEVFEDELAFLATLVEGRFQALGRSLQVVYNGIGFGITTGGFQPGRMALIPAVADSYGIVSAHSDAYTCAFALHRYHSFLVLRALGVAAPPVWHYRLDTGWMGGPPPRGTKVIAKSTYEAWSVGVTEDSVFMVDAACDRRVATIAEAIGQPVTVQEFVSGREVCVPIFALPERIVPPIVEQILSKAPGDLDAVMTIDDNLTRGAVDYEPFDGPPALVDEIERTSLRVFDIIQAQAVGRMDFRIDAAGRPWLTDAAITPGWSTGSAVFASLVELGFDHPECIRIVVGATLAARGLLDLAA